MGFLNEWGRRSLTVGLVAGLLTSAMGCSMLGLSDDEDDDTLLLLAAAYALTYNVCSGGASTGSTISNSTAQVGSDGCISGVTTSMDSGLPSWIKDNFKCAVGYVSTVDSRYFCFKSKNLPNHASYYWGNGATLFAALPNLDGTQHTAAGTNQIRSQNMVYAIPVTPTRNTGTLTGTQAGYASIGMTRNGVAIFNNAAAAPDTLANEKKTFDAFGSHPQTSGITHHHAFVLKFSNDTTAGNSTNYNIDTNLIGIALDGYAIYGENCSGQSNGTATGLDSYHGHTTTTAHFSTATYHYHYAYDSTATIKTLMGSYFYGIPGTISN